MHIIESITKYPLNLFVDPQEIGFFWQLLVNNCGDAVILNLHSLVNDTDGRNLSLERLKNSVRKWLRLEYVPWYDERLRAARFPAVIREIAERIDIVRDKHVAHSEWHADAVTPAVPHPGISEAEIEKLYQAVRELFRACCLTAEYVIDWNDHVVGKPNPRAIDRVLDLVAKAGNYVNRPERRGRWWALDRQALSEAELATLAMWRAKFGLPPP
jgi:hypothetical protein